MTLRTITFDDSIYKLVPREPDEEMVSAALCGRVMPQSCDALERIHQQMKSDLATAIAAAPEYQEPPSALAPDPRMNEQWSNKEKSDLHKTLSDIFKWNLEPAKEMICSRCGADRFKEPCRQADIHCPMVGIAQDIGKDE